jgi:uncharacterized protein (UPF0147 family)
MIKMKEVQQIIEALNELQGDIVVPRNVKVKIGETIKILEEDTEMSIKVSKALNELEEVADDANLQPFTRTQIWNVISMLEKV